MGSPILSKQLITRMRVHGALIISLILLILSILYCLLSFYLVSMDFSGAYVVTVMLTTIFSFAKNAISTLQTAACFIWVTVAFLLIIMSPNHQLTVIVCSILIPIIFMFGTVSGLFALQIKFVASLGHQNNLYHLNYIYNWRAENGYYSVLNCDSSGFRCQEVFKSSMAFPRIDKDAEITIDSDNTLFVIVGNEMLYSHILE